MSKFNNSKKSNHYHNNNGRGRNNDGDTRSNNSKRSASNIEVECEIKLENISLNNSLSTISFCDKECYNVNRDNTKDKLIRYIESKFDIQIIKNQYVMINPKILYNISKHEHFITTLTNGNPYLMYLTVIDDTKWCIFIDRKLKKGYSYPKIHCTQYDFDDELFTNETIFNGELVRDVNRHWKFLIGDIIIYRGKNMLKQKNFLSRIELVHNILKNEYSHTPNIEICPLLIKRVFQYSEIKYIFENFIPDLSYTCRGLVFNTMNSKFSNYVWIMPKDQQIRVRKMNDEEAELGFVIDANKTFVKPKDVFSSNMCRTIPDSKYIDKTNEKQFTITNSSVPDIYNLYENGDKEIGCAYIPNISVSLMLNNYFAKFNEKEADSIISGKVNCIYHTYFDRWIPIEIIE